VSEALVDTDILSELLRGRNSGVVQRARKHVTEFGPFSVSAVTVMEIAKGLEKIGRFDELEPVLNRLGSISLLSFGAAESRLAGRIHGALERMGTPIGRADPMIAATALVHGLTLVSGNVQHYRRVVEAGFTVRLENWRE
jgi:predicted nucleic acid-binding protein